MLAHAPAQPVAVTNTRWDSGRRPRTDPGCSSDNISLKASSGFLASALLLRIYGLRKFLEPRSLDLSPFQPCVYQDKSSSSSHPLFPALAAPEAQSWCCPSWCLQPKSVKVQSILPVLSWPLLLSFCPHSIISGVLMLCSLPALPVPSALLPSSLHRWASTTASCHGDQKIVVSLGMGAGPAFHSTGLRLHH